ncbi:hypothetical protein V6N12_051274 [Hibiscus sabdariffa]|uniref:Uncharacterized protein n=1 Tax=Hibiscus sabdariffa TaxID=183260 RepID=A0ABR2GG55_9ROSI
MLTEEITNDPTIVFEKYLRMTNEFRILLEKIEKYAAFPPSRGEVQMDTAITLVEMPARVHLTREVGHWTYGYHLNDRLYEELLVSVFDVLDEGKLTKDMEEILELFARNLNEIDVSEILVGASVKENVMASIMNVNDFVMSLALCRNLNEIDVSEILVGASVKENVMASIMNVNDFVMSLALCSPKVVNDGVTTARAIELSNAMENVGDSLEERKQQGFLREEIERDDLEKFRSLKVEPK